MSKTAEKTWCIHCTEQLLEEDETGLYCPSCHRGWSDLEDLMNASVERPRQVVNS